MKESKIFLFVFLTFFLQLISTYTNAEAGTYIGELCFQVGTDDGTTDYTFSVTHMGGNNYALHGFSPQLKISQRTYGGTTAHGSATISGSQIFMNFNISRRSNSSTIVVDSLINAILDSKTLKGAGHVTSIVYTGTDQIMSYKDIEIKLVPCQ